MESKSLFKERLVSLVQRSGKSMNSVEKELNYPRNALSNYKNGVTPSAIRLLEVAQYFGVTPEYMLGLTSDEQKNNTRIDFSNLCFEEKVETYKWAVKWMAEEITKNKRMMGE